MNQLIHIFELEGVDRVACGHIPPEFSAQCQPGTVKILAVTAHRPVLHGAAIGRTGAVIIRYAHKDSIKFTVAVCGLPKE